MARVVVRRRTVANVVVSIEMAKMLHRVQQLRNGDPDVVIKICSTPDASLALEVNGEYEVITRRKPTDDKPEQT